MARLTLLESEDWAAELAERHLQRRRKALQKKDAIWSQLSADESLLREEGAGVNPKTEYAIRALQRKWLAFVALYGDEMGFLQADGPQLQHVRQFTSFIYHNREAYSGVGRVGMSHQFKEQVRYLLPKFVFPRRYASWSEASETELEDKCCAFNAAIGVRWKCLAAREPQVEKHGTGTPFQKVRWTDRFYWVAQDWVIGNMRGAELVTYMGVMSFVRATCCRSGSMAKDAEDERPESRWWYGNVLSVGDFTWSAEGMQISETGETDALHGEVKINRIKRHYFELYSYLMSFTADVILEVARRASTWIAAMLFARAVFAVQYDGMDADEIESALRVRREHGHRCGMPIGAKVTKQEAARRWVAGERGYLRQLLQEPLFVKMKKCKGVHIFTTKEMSANYVGHVFREVADSLGAQPHSSGVNSMRRNAVVNVQRNLESGGFSTKLAQKLINHHGGMKVIRAVWCAGRLILP